MPPSLKALPLLLLFSGMILGQPGTAVDCVPNAFTFTTATVGASIPNSDTGTPCVSWRITYNSTGFSAFSIQFETSPDNSSWTVVPNTVCTSSVQPPCVIDGANPSTTTGNATFSVRAYGRYVRLNVTSKTGNGSITARVYGYKGLSASGGSGGSGGAGGFSTLPIPITFDGGGFALVGTATRCYNVPYAATISKWALVADQAGSITIGVKSVALASYTGPASASSISSPDPALSSAVVNSSSSLGSWNTAITADTVLCFVMSAPTTVTWASLTIQVTK